jgi:hypothetical protein
MSAQYIRVTSLKWTRLIWESLQEGVVHLSWHKKFRVYFALRKAKFPELKDMAMSSWTDGEKARILDHLVELWKQVDGDAPWFGCRKYLSAQPLLTKKKNAQIAAQKAAAFALQQR